MMEKLLTTLTDLSNKFGSDKGTEGPSISYGAHNYTDIYEAYMSAFRNMPINLLEIGIGVTGQKWTSYIVHGKNSSGGASLKMWYSYFHLGKIYGIDINPAGYLDNDRITTFAINQGDISELNKLKDFFLENTFDFIIDDGSHKPEHQQLCLNFFFQYLKPNGLYFIEDLENNGYNDREKGRNWGRHKSKTVYNTRKVLKAFKSTGTFMKPNGFYNESYLLENIDSINFHAPLYKIYPFLLYKKVFSRRSMMVQFKKETERLCAIRKIIIK